VADDLHPKLRTARLLGYGDDWQAMDRDHDRLHAALCRWLGVPSHALEIAAGQSLPFERHALANYEEDAVLFVQRLMRAHGVDVPE